MISLILLTMSLSMAPTMSQFTCQGVGFYPHPADCSQFYRCTDLWATGQYQQYVFNCAPGTVFDSEIGVCNWPSQVRGCGAVEQENATTISTPISTTPPTTPPTWLASEGSMYQCEEPGVVADQ